MVGLLLDLVIKSGVNLTAESEPGVPVPLGYVVLGLIGIPVVALVLLSIFTAPKNRKISLLFLACMGVLVGATIVGFAAGGFALSVFFNP